MSASRIESLMEERKTQRLALASERALAALSSLEKAGLSAWIVGSLARGTFSVHSDVDFLVDCSAETEGAAFRILESEMRDFLGTIRNNPAVITTIVKPGDEGMSVTLKLEGKR